MSKLSTAVFLLVLVSTATACDETFDLDSTVYPVPDRWCGQQIDSTLLAVPDSLVRLPEDLCWAATHIYVTRATRAAFVAMAAAAERDSVFLLVKSGYRSSRYQRELIRRRLREGQDITTILKYVAPPGYSEHETGRALDLVWPDGPFEKSPAYRWLKAHADSFGFRESMPEPSPADAPAGPPVAWEPWHWYYFRQ